MQESKEQNIIDSINRTNARIRDLEQQKDVINKLINTNKGTRAKLQDQLKALKMERYK